MNSSSIADNHGRDNSEFICGVVEGFYGRPWTFDQRKDLFKTLKDLKLNSFMYAPKDDAKHRAKWRQLYSDQEAKDIKSLIDEAKSMGIDFYYSLAPGLDMIYSDQEELSLLVKKYDQIVSLGCESFAILFDDIEPSIQNEKDKNIFNNYAMAQVSVTNMIFEHLKRPKFLFCPTEYCESRAVPDVSNSNYLNTIGTGLMQGIDIMWSGSRVISRLITEDSIDRLTQVIRRPPVIWENLHANDYDKKRVFLGPYSGRSTKIIPKLRGVLTNPNCEYEANYIAIHTLSQWSRCTKDINSNNCCHPLDLRNGLNNEASTQQDHLMTSGDDTVVDTETTYDPHLALKRAIKDWLPQFTRSRLLPKGIELDFAVQNHLKDHSLEASNQLNKETNPSPECNHIEVQDEESNVDMIPEDSRSSTSTSKSEMDTTSAGGHSQQVCKDRQPFDGECLDNNSCESCEMQVITKRETTDDVREQQQAANEQASDAPMWPHQPAGKPMASFEHPPIDLSSAGHTDQILNQDGLSLLVDLFYLPFEHGHHGNSLLEQIKWLRDHHESGISIDMLKQGPANVHGLELDQSNGRKLSLWMERVERLGHLCASINRLVNSLIKNNQLETIPSIIMDMEQLPTNCAPQYHCPNKLLVIDLYPYLVDLQDASTMIMDYIKFLRYRSPSLDRVYGFSESNKQRDPVCQDEQEPWIHRGGLLGDVQRLLS